MTSTENILGKNIKKLRALKGLDRKELAEGVGTTYRTVSSWETGEKKPRLNKLEEISKFLGVETSVLLKQELLTDEYLLNSIKNEAPVERLAQMLYERYMSVPDKYKPHLEEELLRYASKLTKEINEQKGK